MTDPNVGGLSNDTVTGSISGSGDNRFCDSPSPSYEYSMVVHAYDDELMNQEYYEVRENKQNRWNVEVFFPTPPESPMPENSPLRSTNLSNIEYHMKPAGKSSGSDRVEFDDPVPSDGDEGNISKGFSVSASASILPGVSVGGSIGYSYDSGTVSYDSSHNMEQDHSYWNVPSEDGDYSTDLENQDTHGVSIDVECYSDNDDNWYEAVGVTAQPTVAYTQENGLGCVPNIYYKTLPAAYAFTSFIVGPP